MGIIAKIFEKIRKKKHGICAALNGKRFCISQQ